MPTTLTVDLFVSVDGFAGSDGLPGYFGYLGPDLQRWIDEAGAAPHVAIMGRRTYEVLAALLAEHRDEAWETMSRRETVVFSSSLAHTDWPAARIHHGELVEEVRRLKTDGDTPLRTVGSMSVARQLLAAGLVDRLRLMVLPLTAGGAGRELAFEGVDCHDLQLVDSRVLDANILLVEYHPTGQDIPRA